MYNQNIVNKPTVSNYLNPKHVHSLLLTQLFYCFNIMNNKHVRTKLMTAPVYMKIAWRFLFLVAHVPRMIQRANYGNKSAVNTASNQENLFSFTATTSTQMTLYDCRYNFFFFRKQTECVSGYFRNSWINRWADTIKQK